MAHYVDLDEVVEAMREQANEYEPIDAMGWKLRDSADWLESKFGPGGDFDPERNYCDETKHARTEQLLSRDVEPPVGTWVHDRFGGTSYRQVQGWGQPGTMPFGKWTAMWDARGPYTLTGPWGQTL